MATERITVIYPNKDGSKFDFDYYMQKHVPWVAKLTGTSIEVRRGISASDGSAAPYVCIATIAASVADFEAVFAKHGQQILADVANYTNIEPEVQFDEVLGEFGTPVLKAAC
jgi:uncharacterized protein (TIGR02118 family)